MSNSKSIGRCTWCDEYYCMECSDAEDYVNFCSKQCEEESREED
jgi:hypothetical protein